MTHKTQFLLGASLAVAALVAGAVYYHRSSAPDPEAQKRAVLQLFETSNCAQCHVFNQAGAFGVNMLGMSMGKGFEGCGPMLDVIKETLTTRESDWTAKHRTARSNFETFGCDSCHRLEGTRIELTSIGRQTGDILHKGCMDMCCPKPTPAQGGD